MALTFSYTVVEGHEALPLDSVGSDSLKPKNFGAIRRKNNPGRGRQADLTLKVTEMNCPGALACSGVLIDGVRPTAIGDIMQSAQNRRRRCASVSRHRRRWRPAL